MQKREILKSTKPSGSEEIKEAAIFCKMRTNNKTREGAGGMGKMQQYKQKSIFS